MVGLTYNFGHVALAYTLKATGIYPFDQNIFNDKDFFEVELSGENICLEDGDNDPDNFCTVVVSTDVIENDTGANEEVTTSGMATDSSAPSTSVAFLCSAFRGVSLLERVKSVESSKRGHKSLASFRTAKCTIFRNFCMDEYIK